jgi:hypothetical protein
MAATFDDVLSTTLAKWVATELADNIFLSNALFYSLRDRAKSVSGGTYLEEPLMTGKSTATGSYSGYEQLNVSAQQGIALAEFNWKQYYASITIDGLSESQNAGDARVIDLLDSKTNQARMSLFDRMNTDAFSDGTGNNSKNLDGLEIAIDSTGTYGGILRSTYTYWAANETAVAGALTIARMRTMFNTCSSGGRRETQPGLIITTQSIHEFYENLLQPDQRFTNTDLADGGFNNLEFKGKPVTWDEACTATNMYFINPQFLTFRYHQARNFASTPFVKPANQDARTALVLFMGNITGSNCRRQGKLTGITS